jgi:hypothetical protein
LQTGRGLAAHRSQHATPALPVAWPFFGVTKGLAGLAAHSPDNPFDEESSTGDFELMGLLPARAPCQGRSLPRLCFAPACAQRRFAVPAAAFDHAAVSRGQQCSMEAAQGAWVQNQDERNIT